MTRRIINLIVTLLFVLAFSALSPFSSARAAGDAAHSHLASAQGGRLTFHHSSGVARPEHARLPVFVTPTGQPAAGPWLRWAAEDWAPVPTVTITIAPASLCPGAVQGCSVGPQPTAPADAPAIAPNYEIYTSSRESFYYELGHIFDWSKLTAADRTYLAGRWHASAWSWWDSTTALAAGYAAGAGVETGLQGLFPEMYQTCASGGGTQDIPYFETVPSGSAPTPTVTSRFDTCAWLDRRF